MERSSLCSYRQLGQPPPQQPIGAKLFRPITLSTAGFQWKGAASSHPLSAASRLTFPPILLDVFTHVLRIVLQRFAIDPELDQPHSHAATAIFQLRIPEVMRKVPS